MKDPGIALRTEYKTLLSDIVYNNRLVPVYDVVPLNATYPHIKIGDRTLLDRSNKTWYGTEVTQQIQVIDRFPANYGSRTSVYTIVQQAKLRIRKIRERLNITGFNVITATVDNENTIQELTDTYFYFRNILTFRHIIEENLPSKLTFGGVHNSQVYRNQLDVSLISACNTGDVNILNAYTTLNEILQPQYITYNGRRLTYGGS